MKYKKILAFGLVTLTACLLASSEPVSPFKGWNWLMQESSDILIVRCLKTPEVRPRVGSTESDVEITQTLKGTNVVGKIMMRSFYEPRQGEYYLVFGRTDSGFLQAIDEYRVIPLGLWGDQINLSGKPLDEQVKELLEIRRNALEWQMKKDQEEMRRLQGGFH